MKRFTVILALILALCSLAVPALAAEGDTTLMQDDGSVGGIFSIGDTFYIHTMQFDRQNTEVAYTPALSTWHTGDEAPALLAQGALPVPEGSDGYQAAYWDFFAGDESGLYAVSGEAGIIQRITVQDGALAAQGEPVFFDTEDLLEIDTYEDREYRYFKQTEAWMMAEGKFWFVLQDWQMPPEQQYQFISIDASTGEVHRFETPYIRLATPYREGKFLVMAADERNAYDQETGEYKPVVISVFDPETDSLADYAAIAGTAYHNVEDIHYDPEADVLYYIGGERIYRLTAGGEGEVAAYVPVSYLWSHNGGSVVAWVGDTAMVRSNTNGLVGLFVRKADPAQVPAQALTVYGSYASGMHNKALAKLGDIPVVFSENVYYSSAQELGEALVSGECDIDVFRISLSYMDFTRLMEKGYCYDLTDTPAIKAFHDALYPMLQDAVSLNGRVYGVPVSMTAGSYMRADRRILEEIGLSAPTSFIGLCEFLNTWGEEEYYDTYSDYLPLSNLSGNYKASLYREALTLYRNYMAKTGQELTLDTPLLRQVFTAIAQVDASDYAEEIDWSDDAAVDEYFSKQEVLANNYMGDITPSVRMYEENIDLIFLPLTDDVEPAAGVQVEVFFVNPRSRNIDAALLYISAYIDALDNSDRIAMCPGLNDPVENANYAENVKYYEDSIAQLEAAVAEAKPADKVALEEQLALNREWYEEYKATGRYDISDESIARYREWAEHFVIETYDPFTTSNTAFQRFVGGQIDLEQYIREAESVLWKIRNE